MMIRYILLFIISFNIYAGATSIPDKDANGNIINKNDAFAAKSNYKFRGTGITCAVAASPAVTNCEYAVTYAHVKFNGVQIINGSVGDAVNLKVIDTATGTYSTVPNATLDQFGFNWNITSDTKEILPYVADLYSGMRIRAEVTNSGSAKTVYINYYIHEE